MVVMMGWHCMALCSYDYSREGSILVMILWVMV